jgi:predicted  nucleic acid-binding Zn-ribbon protein
MKEQLLSILELQKCEKQLKQVEKNLAQQEQVKEIFKLEKHKDKVDGQLGKTVDNLAKLEEELSQLDLDLEQLNTKVKELERKLYSGEKADAKKLISLQEKLAETKKSLENKESKYYNLLEEKDRLAKDIVVLKKEQQAVKTSLTKGIANYKEKRIGLIAEKERLQNHRNKLNGSIDKDLLTRYNQKQGDELVVLVVGGNCSNCGVKINFDMIRMLKKYESLERCEYCGKILFFQ